MTRDSIDKKMIETVAVLVEQIAEIRDNHLPHMQNRLDTIDERMWKGTIAITGILMSILITLLFK